MALFGLIGRPKYERTGFELYTDAVRAARSPLYFTELAVPDTLDGRFDLVGLFVALLIRRLRAIPDCGAAMAQAVFDAMFADMDHNLRELGVGDMAIAKRVKAMWEAFHGRAQAYQTRLDAQDAAGLAEALERNVWRGEAPAGSAVRLADAALVQERHLAAQGNERFTAGHSCFLPAEETMP